MDALITLPVAPSAEIAPAPALRAAPVREGFTGDVEDGVGAATDASGEGSRSHGRTSDRAESLDVMLADGTGFTLRPRDRVEIEAAMKASPDTGLSSEARASPCSVNVDIPSMRPRFLAAFRSSRPRPARDRPLRHLEAGLAAVRRVPGPAGAPMDTAPSRRLPRELFRHRVTLSAVRPDGKVPQVLGDERAFARRASAERPGFAAGGLAAVIPDAAADLLHGNEYKEYAKYFASWLAAPAVLVGRFPADEAATGRLPAFGMMLHRTEETADSGTAVLRNVDPRHLGMEVPPRPGCCGMGRMSGHRAEQADLSRRIFDTGWRPRLGPDPSRVRATGFSGGRRAQRSAGFRPRHPIEAVLARLEDVAG